MFPEFLTKFEGYDEYVIMNKETVDDGAGGYIERYVPGATFRAVLTLDDSIDAQRAMQEGVTGVYTLTCEKGLRLPWHTVFVRKSTNDVYRVSAKDDKSTPSGAGFDLRTVRCEEWELT